jgi:hypothetical protein
MEEAIKVKSPPAIADRLCFLREPGGIQTIAFICFAILSKYYKSVY